VREYAGYSFVLALFWTLGVNLRLWAFALRSFDPRNGTFGGLVAALLVEHNRVMTNQLYIGQPVKTRNGYGLIVRIDSDSVQVCHRSDTSGFWYLLDEVEPV